MAKEFKRTDRVSQEMQKEIAIILQREIKDPRLSIVTVSGVAVSRDLGHAKVYVTFLDGEDTLLRAEKIKVLQDAAGYIRTLLGKSMRLRVVPQLHFFYDNSLLDGIKMSALLSKVVAEDRQKRQHNGEDDGDTTTETN